MGRVSIVSAEEARLGRPRFAIGEGAEGRAYFESGDDPIHVHVYTLEPGGRVRWGRTPSDLVLFVWKGTIHSGEVELCAASSMILERNAAANVGAGQDGATIVSFRAVANLTERAGGRVHLLPADRVPRRTHFQRRASVGGALYADAACPTCEVWLHENNLWQADWKVGVHSHSEDEIIFVTSGAIRLGARVFGPGTAILVTADTKYGFVTGPEGLTFINFRPGTPTYTSGDGGESWSEAEKWVQDLGARPEYLEIAS